MLSYCFKGGKSIIVILGYCQRKSEVKLHYVNEKLIIFFSTFFVPKWIMFNCLDKFLLFFFFNSIKELKAAKQSFSNSLILFKCFLLTLGNEIYISMDGHLL